MTTMTVLIAAGALLVAGCSTSAPLAKTVETTETATTSSRTTKAPTRSTAPPTSKAAPKTVPPTAVVVTVVVTIVPTAAPAAPSTAPPTPAPTAARATTPVGPAASIPLDVAALAGSYFGHDRALVVQPNGTMHLEERSFTFCSDNPAPPCDNVINNEIHSGIQIDLKVQSGSGPTGNAVVTSSTDPTIPVGTPVVLTKTPDEIAFTGGGLLDGQIFCTKNAVSGECGA